MAAIQVREQEARERVLIGDILLDRVGTQALLAQCRRAIKTGGRLHIVTANLQFLTVARRDSYFRSVVNRAGLVVADGMPVVWLSSLYGSPVPERITGHDLVSLFAENAAQEGYSLFLLGGAPDSAVVAAAKLRTRYPGLRIAGTMECTVSPDGSFTSGEDGARVIEAVRQARPDFLLVALGCPKQELWIAKHLEHIQVPIAVGVGSVFDVLAGRARRAPRWMQRWGLEWVYRMAQEPARLGKRYLMRDLPTAGVLAARGMGQRLGLARRTREPADAVK